MAHAASAPLQGRRKSPSGRQGKEADAFSAEVPQASLGRRSGSLTEDSDASPALSSVSLRRLAILHDIVHVMMVDPDEKLHKAEGGKLPELDLIAIRQFVGRLALRLNAVLVLVNFKALSTSDMLLLSRAVSDGGGVLWELEQGQAPASYLRKYKRKLSQLLPAASYGLGGDGISK